MSQLQHNDLDGVGEGKFYYPGPVARAYETDFSQRKTFIAGPTGGGKTFSSSRKCLNATLNQTPSVKDQIRRAKIVVICPSYVIMENTVVPSFKKVVATEGKGRAWDGSKGRPQEFTLKGRLPDGSGMDMLMWWRAVGDLDYDEFFRGLECTFFWLPETDTSLSREMMGYMANRWGREYLEHVAPGKGLSCYGVIGDSNTPFVGTYFHEMGYLGLRNDELIQAEGRPGERAADGGVKLYKQPPGFDPNSPDGWPRDAAGNILAENWKMLMKRSPSYYLEAANDMVDPAMVKRLLQCIPTSPRFGLPVHEAFDPDFHCTHLRLTPDPDKKVFVGIDGTGLCPAAVFYQRTIHGQWRAIREFAPMTHDYDSVDFGHAIKAILMEDFGGARGGVLGCYDPASSKRSQADKRFQEWQIIQRAAGIPMMPAPTNDHNARKTSMDRLLKASDRIEGRSVPRLLVSRSGCPNLIRALSGGYSYKKRGDSITPEVDKKNPLTNVAEAAQYAPLTIEGIDGRGGMSFSAQGDRDGRRVGEVQVTRAGSRR